MAHFAHRISTNNLGSRSPRPRHLIESLEARTLLSAWAGQINLDLHAQFVGNNPQPTEYLAEIKVADSSSADSVRMRTPAGHWISLRPASGEWNNWEIIHTYVNLDAFNAEFGDGPALLEVHSPATGTQTVAFTTYQPGTRTALPWPSRTPVLLSPLHGQTDVPTNTTISWQSLAGAGNEPVDLEIYDAADNEVVNQSLPPDQTSYGPLALAAGAWYNLDLDAANHFTVTDADGVVVTVNKEYELSVVFGTTGVSSAPADLILSSLTADNQTLVAGDAIVATLTGGNIGGRAALDDAGSEDRPVLASFILSRNQVLGDRDDFLLGTRPSEGFLPAPQFTADMDWYQLPSSVTPGDYYLAVVFDSAGQVTESDESNNIAWTPSANIHVQAPTPVFDASSADCADVPFVHLKPGDVFATTGTGGWAGGTQDFDVSQDEFLGVNCLRLHEVDILPGEDLYDALGWLAKDVQGQVWLLKFVEGGQVEVEASSVAQAMALSQMSDVEMRITALLVDGSYTVGSTTSVGEDGEWAEILSTSAALPQYPGYQFVEVQGYHANGTTALHGYYHPSMFHAVIVDYYFDDSGNPDGFVLNGWPTATPTDLSLSTMSIAENLPAGTAVGSLATTDPTAGDAFTYTLVPGDGSADNASFAIDGNTLKTAASFDFETRGSYSIRVRSTDQSGLSFEKSFTIAVTNVDEPLPDTLGPTATLAKPPAIKAGAAKYLLKVTFTDASLVNRRSLNSKNIYITGPKKYKAYAKLISAAPKANSTRITATYQMVLPGKTWDPADNGTYVVWLMPRQVNDARGNFAGASSRAKTKLGSITVKLKTRQKRAPAAYSVAPSQPSSPARLPFSATKVINRTWLD